MSHDEKYLPERGERTVLTYAIYFALAPLLLIVGVILIFVLGGSPTAKTTATSGPTQAEESGLENARQTLMRQSDLNSCRTALQQINSEWTEKPALRSPAMSEEQTAWLRRQFNLDEGELGEVQSGTFTRLDGPHLECCFLMRDAARALEVKRSRAAGDHDEKPLHRVERAFAWVTRQVRLREPSGEEVPPDFAVRRGWGSATERALVFLALLEQLGDPKSPQPEQSGCLLYVPDESKKLRLWACGVVLGESKELYLFDPRLGLPLPGPKGEGVATLAAIRKDPEILAQLNLDDKHRYDVTAEQARAAQAFLVAPLSSLSPRMRSLQVNVLAPAVKVRLAVDANKELQRVTAAGVSARMAKEYVTLPRRFLPPEEGGIDEGAIVRRGDSRKIPRKVRATIELVPATKLPPQFRNNPNFPLNSALGERVQKHFATPFIRSTLEAGQARDQLLRGRYSAAEPLLVTDADRLREYQKARAAAVDLEDRLEKWMEKAVSAYAEMLQTDPHARAEGERRVKALWGDRSAPIYPFLFSAVAPIRGPEINYQLALCAQEQAEQLQARLDLLSPDATDRKWDVEKAQKAWQEALNAWKRFEDDNPSPDDAEAARQLRGRAESLSGDWKAAIATWTIQDDSKPTLEKLALLYLARQLEKQHAK